MSEKSEVRILRKIMITGKTILEIDNAIYEHLRNNQEDFVFGIRTKNDKTKRFLDGFRFRGNDDYISISLVKTECNKTKTSAIHIDFDKNKGLYLFIVFDGVDSTLQKHYENIAKSIGCTLSSKLNSYRYEKKYSNKVDINSISDLCNEIDKFIKGDYNKIKKYLETNCSDELWRETEFVQLLKNTDQKWQELRMKQPLQQAVNVTTDQPNDDINHTLTTMNAHPLNLILYGPPGTGKTYNTVNEALDIIQPKWREDFKSQPNLPKGIKDERDYALYLFNQYKDEGRIVFTTFHQSLSYEEFIEGIKPIPGQIDIMAIHNNATNPTPGATQFGEGTTKVEKFPIIKFDVLPGIFKQLCEQASASNTKVVACEMPKTATVEISPIKIDELLKEFHEKIVHQGSITVTVDGHSYKISSTSDSFQVQKQGTKAPQAVTDATIKRDWDLFKNGKIKSDDDIPPTKKSNNRAIGTKVGHWATYNALKNFEKELLQKKMQTASNESETTETISENVPQNYVLIIDEINRGNVSQIFGELITLIEEDKRTTKWDDSTKTYVDNPEKISVTLPYSNESFGVPANLYIIGTMNTADRSVEALDTALRRRFDFKEMMPNPKLLDEQDCKKDWQDDLKDLLENKVNKSLKEILETINNRIRVLKDREHQIGHSYFMKCKTVEDLKNVFKNNIVPLLQEYFYGNYAYIGLVLGNGFVKEDDEAKSLTFANFNAEKPEREVGYKLLTDEEWDKLNMEEALDGLMGREEKTE